MKIRCLFLVLFCAFAMILSSQTIIPIINGDFEVGLPNSGTLAKNWIDFGDKARTPPDLHGKSTNLFKCSTKSFSGKQFVGLVTRSDFTTEAIGQKLDSPMLVGHNYSISLCMATAENYQSLDVQNMELANYTAPVILRIWGAKSKDMEDGILLASSESLFKSDWKTVDFLLKIKEFDCNWIVFQVWYPTNSKATTGNILLDKISDLTDVSN
jgi:hypothetical protein